MFQTRPYLTALQRLQAFFREWRRRAGWGGGGVKRGRLRDPLEAQRLRVWAGSGAGGLQHWGELLLHPLTEAHRTEGGTRAYCLLFQPGSAGFCLWWIHVVSLGPVATSRANTTTFFSEGLSVQDLTELFFLSAAAVHVNFGFWTQRKLKVCQTLDIVCLITSQRRSRLAWDSIYTFCCLHQFFCL